MKIIADINALFGPLSKFFVSTADTVMADMPTNTKKTRSIKAQNAMSTWPVLFTPFLKTMSALAKLQKNTSMWDTIHHCAIQLALKSEVPNRTAQTTSDAAHCDE